MNDENTPVNAVMYGRITEKLQALAKAEGFRILYAAESGNRAWGFGSPDSDYDVRFIYARDLEWYLRLSPGRDVCEAGIDDHLIDLSGWDIDKGLKLLVKSNPALYEWLVSPVVYDDDGEFANAARNIFETNVDLTALAHHYRSIASGQWRREISGKIEVRLKKYFYVIRPLLSLQHVLAGGKPPPMQIDALLAEAEIPVAVHDAIAQLIEVKTITPEFGAGARIKVIDDWVEPLLSAEIPDLSKPGSADQRLRQAQSLFNRTVGLAQL